MKNLVTKKNNNEIYNYSIDGMAAAVIIIPILVVTIIALSSYLVYKLFLQNSLSKRSINQTLEKYNIDKTPFQIIKEYYENKGESLSHQEIQKLEKNYIKNEPEQFLAMYDAIEIMIKVKKNSYTYKNISLLY